MAQPVDPRPLSQVAEEDDVCRVCQQPRTAEEPLYHPCKCRGSIKFVHQTCLLRWLRQRNRNRCEVCWHQFDFEPVYRPDAPLQPSVRSILHWLLGKVWRGLPQIGRFVLVLLVWLFALPFYTRVLFLACYPRDDPPPLLPLPLKLSTLAEFVGRGWVNLMFVFLGLSLIAAVRDPLLPLIRSVMEELRNANGGPRNAANRGQVEEEDEVNQDAEEIEFVEEDVEDDEEDANFLEEADVGEDANFLEEADEEDDNGGEETRQARDGDDGNDDWSDNMVDEVKAPCEEQHRGRSEQVPDDGRERGRNPSDSNSRREREDRELALEWASERKVSPPLIPSEALARVYEEDRELDEVAAILGRSRPSGEREHPHSQLSVRVSPAHTEGETKDDSPRLRVFVGADSAPERTPLRDPLVVRVFGSKDDSLLIPARSVPDGASSTPRREEAAAQRWVPARLPTLDVLPVAQHDVARRQPAAFRRRACSDDVSRMLSSPSPPTIASRAEIESQITALRREADHLEAEADALVLRCSELGLSSRMSSNALPSIITAELREQWEQEAQMLRLRRARTLLRVRRLTKALESLVEGGLRERPSCSSSLALAPPRLHPSAVAVHLPDAQEPVEDEAKAPARADLEPIAAGGEPEAGARDERDDEFAALEPAAEEHHIVQQMAGDAAGENEAPVVANAADGFVGLADQEEDGFLQIFGFAGPWRRLSSAAIFAFTFVTIFLYAAVRVPAEFGANVLHAIAGQQSTSELLLSVVLFFKQTPWHGPKTLQRYTQMLTLGTPLQRLSPWLEVFPGNVTGGAEWYRIEPGGPLLLNAEEMIGVCPATVSAVEQKNLYDAILAGNWHNFANLVVGYVIMAWLISAIILLPELWRFSAAELVSAVSKTVRLWYILIKATMVMVVELVFMPIVVGAMIDAAVAFLFGPVPWADGESLMRARLLFNWLGGFLFMCCLVLFLSLCKPVFRQEFVDAVLIDNRADNEFDLVGDVKNTSLFSYALSAVKSLIGLALLVLFCVHVPLRIVGRAFPSLFSASVRASDGADMSAGLLANQLLLLPLLLHRSEIAGAFVAYFETWLVWSAEALGFDVFLKPEARARRPMPELLRHAIAGGGPDEEEEEDENADEKEHEEKEAEVKEDRVRRNGAGDEGHGERVRENALIAADAGDDEEEAKHVDAAEQAVGDRRGRALDGEAHAANAGRADHPDVALVHVDAAVEAAEPDGDAIEVNGVAVPLGPFLALGVAVWVGFVLLACLFLLLPLTVGRWASTVVYLFASRRDIVLHAFGLNICVALVRILFMVASALRALQMKNPLPALFNGFMLSLKALVLCVLFVGVLPMLIGLWCELSIVLPMRMNADETPVFFLYQNWIAGIFILRTMYRALLAGLFGEVAFKAKVEAVFRQGPLQASTLEVLREVFWPVCRELLLLLCVPYLFSRGLVPLLLERHFGTASPLHLSLVFRSSFSVVALCRVLAEIGAVLLRCGRDLHRLMLDDLYLVGRRLNNYAEKPPSSLAAPLPAPEPAARDPFRLVFNEDH